MNRKVDIPKHLDTEEWIRMPKPGDRYMGLTRTTLLEIVLNPEAGVRSAVIKKKHARRGIRLIHRGDLLAHFSKLAGVVVSDREEIEDAQEIEA
jgi:hypothetical protein